MSGPKPRPVAERFWLKVDQSAGLFGCWEWLAAKSLGYGVIWVDGSRGQRHAHRVAYEMLVGPIPDGLTIDHLCRNRGCVNPAHMEPVTAVENVLRGTSVFAVNHRKTHCKLGHPYNHTDSGGSRRCLTCFRAARRRRYAERRLDETA